MKPPTNCIAKAILLFGFVATATSVSGTAITNGTINLSSYLSAGTFVLSGNGFAVSGSFDAPAFTALLIINSCRPCSSGYSLPVSGQIASSSFHGGSGTIGATTYPSVLWGDDMAAHGSVLMITGAPITLNGPGTYTGSFSLTGFLCGTTTGGQGLHDCTVDLLALTGSGQVSVNIVQDSENLLRSDSAIYTFTAVPEPSTVVLAVPLLAILLRRRQSPKSF